ncbi:MAG: cytochrome c-type biogenesis protein CcmH [Proteobacteria bacterium]|nr:cytochrome c-type biogenesis protein CcmH [Pseudomonadota bacterium]
MIATRRWMVLLTALLLSAGAGAIDTEAAFADAARQARYEHLTNELRCLVCQNQTIADSNAGLAGDLRREVKELIAAGKTDDEIRQFLTARYGDFVLYNPPLTARTLLLWAAPALLVLVTVGAAARVIVRRSKAPIDADPEDMV